jgi:hypothetical protein
MAFNDLFMGTVPIFVSTKMGLSPFGLLLRNNSIRFSLFGLYLPKKGTPVYDWINVRVTSV